MNTSTLPRSCLLLCAAVVPALTARAQVLVPGYSGIQRLALLGNSDSYISAPYARSRAATALVQSVLGSVVTVKGVSPWVAGRFVNSGGPNDDSFYLFVVSGTSAGSSYLITANTASTLTVDLDGDTLNAAPNDRLAVIPYWTLGTLFPGGLGVHVSPSSGDLRTEIILPDVNATTLSGGNLRYFYCLAGNWLEKGQPPAPKNNVAILPDSLFIVRHNAASATEFLANGAVVTSGLRTPLGVTPTSKRDNFLGLQRPTSFTLAGSGLVTSGAFAASLTAGNRTDELLVYDNTLVRQNKSASAIYYYWNNGWRKVGSGAALFDNTVIFTPGKGFIIRKNAGSASPTWLNLPNY